MALADGAAYGRPWCQLCLSVCCFVHCLLWGDAAAAAKPLQLCPTLRDPLDGSPPGSPVPGILQAGALEWVDWL